MKFLLSKLLSRLTQKKKDERRPKVHRKPGDTWFVVIIFLLSVIGIVMVYNSSVAIAIRDFSDQYHFVRDQLRWLVLGYIAFSVFAVIDYHKWYALALPLLLASAVMLLLVFVPGLGVRALGAHRWISMGPVVLQPAEFAKFALVVYFSAWFSRSEKQRLVAFLLLVGAFVGLVVIEPDLGTASIILVIALVMYFLSGAPVYQFLLLLPVVVGGIMGFAFISPYRFRRLTTFLNPESDPLGASYQIRQVLLAFGSGGLFGVGFGKSRQKYEYLPEANTDSIFAILAEEVGFLGASAVIGLFVLLAWRGFRIARAAPDTFGRLLASGIIAWVSVQALTNLAAMVALIPLTGVPLPLVSYGGSSLVITLSGLGIVYNISKHV